MRRTRWRERVDFPKTGRGPAMEPRRFQSRHYGTLAAAGCHVPSRRRPPGDHTGDRGLDQWLLADAGRTRTHLPPRRRSSPQKPSGSSVPPTWAEDRPTSPNGTGTPVVVSNTVVGMTTSRD